MGCNVAGFQEERVGVVWVVLSVTHPAADPDGVRVGGGVALSAVLIRRDAILLVIGIEQDAQHELPGVVHALDAMRLELCLAQRGQEQAGQDCDDGDDDKKFDQRKAVPCRLS